MKHKTKGVISILLSLTLLISLFPLKAQAKTITSIENGSYGGYDYGYWKDIGNGTMELKEGGAFSCEWSDVNNILFKNGFKYDETQTHQQIGNISISYECDYQANGTSYMGVYGWTNNPFVEYYIIENWSTWKPPGNVQSKGTITVDGGVYDIYETAVTFQPSIIGTVSFQQYWSVRQQTRTSGTVSVSEHFKAWEALGMQLGKIYDLNLYVEGYKSSGKADITKMSIDIEPYPSLIGDANSDGKVDVLDFAMLRKYILGMVDSVSATADVNKDGSIDSIDFGMLREHLLGIIDLESTTQTNPPVATTPSQNTN